MKYLIIILAVLSIVGYKPASAVHVGGVIEESITWEKQYSPYMLVDNLEVGKNAVLSIEPGVEVICGDTTGIYVSGYPIIVKGAIKARGSVSDSIIFYSHPHKESLRVGDWTGIHIYDSSATDSSLLEYCVIKDANRGVVCYGGTSPVIKNCHIEAEIDGVYLIGNNALVTGNTIIAGRYALAINCVTANICSNAIQSHGAGNSIVCFEGAAPQINYNDIIGPFTCSAIGDSIDAKNNYWGTAILDSILLLHHLNGRVSIIPYSTSRYQMASIKNDAEIHRGKDEPMPFIVPNPLSNGILVASNQLKTFDGKVVRLDGGVVCKFATTQGVVYWDECGINCENLINGLFVICVYVDGVFYRISTIKNGW